ncbi:MAG: hypothetical protein JO101_03050 [Candidatus Eremiobacteraeota bacterium]|nr:hypothetical protein [Candidatus Eremiobacteraeota bacterium]MBV8354270.1 hypothetical protein [Candidatus Eremiobacteraeota bacterium]
MDRTQYAASPSGVLNEDALGMACRHVWRDSNSTVMLGPDPLTSEPVSCDDEQALAALRRHIAAAGRRGFLNDVLPRLGFGRPAPRLLEDDEIVLCARCGKEGVRLHAGCVLCDECCDCRQGLG